MSEKKHHRKIKGRVSTIYPVPLTGDEVQRRASRTGASERSNG